MYNNATPFIMSHHTCTPSKKGGRNKHQMRNLFMIPTLNHNEWPLPTLLILRKLSINEKRVQVFKSLLVIMFSIDNLHQSTSCSMLGKKFNWSFVSRTILQASNMNLRLHSLFLDVTRKQSTICVWNKWWKLMLLPSNPDISLVWVSHMHFSLLERQNHYVSHTTKFEWARQRNQHET